MTGPVVVTALPGTRCPTCGLDVSGWAVGTSFGGDPTWERPTYTAAGPSGVQQRHGGLVHIQGGPRCIPHGGDPDRITTPSPP